MDPSANPFAALSLIVAPARGPRRARVRGGVGRVPAAHACAVGWGPS